MFININNPIYIAKIHNWLFFLNINIYAIGILNCIKLYKVNVRFKYTGSFLYYKLIVFILIYPAI